jgi:hypothetical protein
MPDELIRSARPYTLMQPLELTAWLRVARPKEDRAMAKKQTSRGRKQDPARVAGRQDYETRYEAKKTGKSKAL